MQALQRGRNGRRAVDEKRQEWEGLEEDDGNEMGAGMDEEDEEEDDDDFDEGGEAYGDFDMLEGAEVSPALILTTHPP